MADLLYFGVRPTDWDDASVPAARAYFYEAGTTNPLATWQDAAGTIPHASPVVADGYGAFPEVYATADADVDVQTEDGESLPGFPRRAVRASAPSASAAGVSFSPTAEIPETNVQEAIESVQDNIEGLGGTGVLVKRASGEFIGRTLTGTADQITVTNGGGDAGNPTIAAVIASQAEAEAGSNTTKLMTPQRVGQAIAALAASTLSASVPASSGTTASLGSLPAGLTWIDLYLQAVSLSGSDDLLVQLGTASGFVTTGYASAAELIGSPAAYTTGFGIRIASASREASGIVRLRRAGTKWFQDHGHGGGGGGSGGGWIDLGGTLTQLRLTPTGSDTFDGSGLFLARYGVL